MANSYFRFKEFTIEQDQCAMKVCTDACILGAWFASTIVGANRILDIGSGTGLLMMMLAQKVNAEIHGVEIDDKCFKQLRSNISQNKWSNRLNASCADIRVHQAEAPYDFIISNPPFFENDLWSRDEREQLAKHSQELSLSQLLQAIDRHLHPDGTFGILLPHNRWKYFDDLATASGFFVRQQLFVRHSPLHPYFRAILHYSRQQGAHVIRTEMSIHQSGGGYTDELITLLKDYYLYL